MRVAVLGLLAGLALYGVPVQAQSTGLFRDYTALTTPRTDIPIGARWIPGTGPDGTADSSNVTVSKGANSLTLNSNLQRDIGFGLSSYLGLSANRSAVRSVNLEGIEIHRVADIGKVQVNAGGQVLYEGIRAKTVELTVDSSVGAELTAGATVRGIPVSANVVQGNTRKITLDGSNLFLAYQVISFDSAQRRETEKRHRGGEVTLNNTYRVTFCRCHENGDVDVRFQILMAPRPDGTFATRMITHRPSPGGWSEISLPRYFNGNRLTAASATVHYNPLRDCSNGITDGAGNPVCFVSFPDSANKITLRTTTFRIRRVERPSGTF